MFVSTNESNNNFDLIFASKNKSLDLSKIVYSCSILISLKTSITSGTDQADLIISSLSNDESKMPTNKTFPFDTCTPTFDKLASLIVVIFALTCEKI